LREQVEEHLEQTAVCGPIDRRTDGENRRVLRCLKGLSDISILAPAEECIGWKPGQVDQPTNTRALTFERSERQLEERP